MEASPRMKVSPYLYNEVSWCFRLLPASAWDIPWVLAVLKAGPVAIPQSDLVQRKRQGWYKWVGSLYGYNPCVSLSFPWHFPYRLHRDICYNKLKKASTQDLLSVVLLVCVWPIPAMLRLMNKKVLDELCPNAMLCVSTSFSLCSGPCFHLIHPP